MERKSNYSKMATNGSSTTGRGPLHELSEMCHPEDLIGKIGMEEVEELFVSMCVYARLGFLQPPCCLQCSYENSESDESKESESRNSACQNPVVWRIKASSSRLLHPEKLKGNLIVMPCSTARSLLRGKVVDGKRWDRKIYTLVDDEGK